MATQELIDMIDNIKLKLTSEEYLKISNTILKINNNEEDCNYLIFYQKTKIETKFTKDNEKYIDVLTKVKSKKVYIGDVNVSSLNRLYDDDSRVRLVPFNFMKKNNIHTIVLISDLDDMEYIYHTDNDDSESDNYERNIMLKYGKYKLIKFKKL